MIDETSTYRQVMKATSIFGGLQVFNILIGIIRSKFIAIILGPVGIGIYGLISTTIAFISSLTNFGLETSGVKNISSANEFGNQKRISTLITVLRRIIWITGLFGAIVTFLFSSMLSKLTFGNYDYSFAFMWLSVTLLLNQLSIGESVIMRGMRKHKLLARAGMFGSLIGLIITVPLYYYFGLKGIVPGFIITSFTTLILNKYFAKKINLTSISISRQKTISESKEMMKMGFMISLSGLITLGVSYLVRIYIRDSGGIDQVGFYYAGFAIINTYVGTIFTAMSTDYFPRLSTVSNDNEKCKTVINQQSEIALLMLGPIIITFLVFGNYAVILLYSSKFLPIIDMILWAAIGMLFKAAGWSIGFIFLAKGTMKLYFWNEFLYNVYALLLNIIGYKYAGLTGLGISFLLSYFIYTIQVYIMANIKFNFKFNKEVFKIFIIQFSLSSLCMISVKILDNFFLYLVGTVIIVISSIFAIKELDRRLNFISIITKNNNKHV